MCCGLGCSFQSGVAAAGPRAAIRAAAPCGGATTPITWGLRAALLRRWRSAGRGYRPDPGWRPCSQRSTCGDPPVANARAAPAAPPPPGGCRRSRPEAIGGVVGEDAHDPGAALDFLIDPLQQVGTPDLSQWSLGSGGTPARPPWPRAMASGRLHLQSGGLGEALHQRGGQIIPACLDFRCGFLSVRQRLGRRPPMQLIRAPGQTPSAGRP